MRRNLLSRLSTMICDDDEMIFSLLYSEKKKPRDSRALAPNFSSRLKTQNGCKEVYEKKKRYKITGLLINYIH